jgi:hypothetical protein
MIIFRSSNGTFHTSKVTKTGMRTPSVVCLLMPSCDFRQKLDIQQPLILFFLVRSLEDQPVSFLPVPYAVNQTL